MLVLPCKPSRAISLLGVIAESSGAGLALFSRLESHQAANEAHQAYEDDKHRDEEPKVNAQDQTAVRSVAICRLRILQEVARADLASMRISVEESQDQGNHVGATDACGDRFQKHPRFTTRVQAEVLDAANRKSDASANEQNFPRKHELLPHICSPIMFLLWLNSDF